MSNLSISDVTNLQTSLDNKQDDIDIYDNFILNSLYVVPFTVKAQVNPSRNGEITASYMTVTDTTNGSYDIGETIVSLTSAVNGKQEEIKTTSGLTLGTLSASGLVTCGDLTVGGKSITTIVNEASGNSLTQSDLDLKQNKLTAGTNITIDTTTNVISATGGVTQSDLNLKQNILNDIFKNEIFTLKANILNLHINEGIFYYNGLSLDALFAKKQDVFTQDFDSFDNKLDVYEANIVGGTSSLTFGSPTGTKSFQTLLLEKQPLITSTSDLTIRNLTCTSVISNGVNINTVLDNKQNTLTPGDNITIVDNTISAFADVSQDDLDLKQDRILTSTALNIFSFNVRAVPQEIVLVTPGEIGCDSLNVGSISNVEETLNGKQDKLLRSSSLNINSLNVSSDTTTTQTDVLGQISCDTLFVGGVDINTVIGTDTISFRATRTIGTTVQTLEVLPFNTITYNLGGGYDDSTYTFTAPKSGIYFFYAVITSNSNNTLWFDFKVNDDGTDNTTIYRFQRVSQASGGNTSFNPSFTTYLNSEDKVYLIWVKGNFRVLEHPYNHWGGHYMR